MAGIRGSRSKWAFFLPGPLYKTIYWLPLIHFWKQVVKYPSLSAKQTACAPFIGFLSGTLNFFQTFFLSLSLFLLTSLSGWAEQLFRLWPALTVFLFLHFSSAVSCLCLSIISSPCCYKSVLCCCYYCSISLEKKICGTALACILWALLFSSFWRCLSCKCPGLCSVAVSAGIGLMCYFWTGDSCWQEMSWVWRPAYVQTIRCSLSRYIVASRHFRCHDTNSLVLPLSW